MKKITITAEELKALARYEKDFRQYLNKRGFFDPCVYSFPEDYTMTLEDLRQALINLIASNPDYESFSANWYFPMQHLEDRLGIKKYREAETAGAEESMLGLLRSEQELFVDIWDDLECFFPWQEKEPLLSRRIDLKDQIDVIDCFRRNQGKPFSEMDFPDSQKVSFILNFTDGASLDASPEYMLDCCRRFTDELCEKGVVDALRLKGYACYGGNQLYACDWKASRDCMLKLYEITDEPGYANTLGYIYYYGRCTGGVPEYEKAFAMFSVAAANGLPEGIYKLADMYLHGFACKKSPRTAYSLYNRVYETSCRDYLAGWDNTFADAALRMGNVYRYGIGVEANDRLAYSCYLAADAAARKRAKDSTFFGDVTVAINIRKALDQTRARFSQDFFKDQMVFNFPTLFSKMADGGSRLQLWLEETDQGERLLHIKRLPRKFEDSPRPFILTIPELDYSELVTEMTLSAPDCELVSDGKDGVILFDDYEWYTDCCDEEDDDWDEDEEEDEDWDEEEGWSRDAEGDSDEEEDDSPICLILTDRDEKVATLTCGPLILKRIPISASGPLLTLVSVSFQPGGRQYDYLCDLKDVQPGDIVVVPGYEGETEVEVLGIYTKYESELGIPPERYKKVIRKAPF